MSILLKTFQLSYADKGILQIASSALFTVLMGVFIKLLNHSVPSSNLLVYRAIVQGLFCGAIAIVEKVDLIGPLEHKKMLNLRGFLGGFQIYLYFSAMQYLPIAMATALFMTTPVYTLFLGAIFLKELITKRKVLAIFIAITGIVLVSHPTSWSSNPNDFYGSLFAIGEAITTAFIVIVIKKIGKIHYSILVFYLSVYMLILGLLLSSTTGFPALSVHQIFLVLLSCICAFLGQALLNAGVQKVSSVTSMTVRSLDVVFAFIFGILLGDEILFTGMIGTVFVLGGSYLIATTPQNHPQNQHSTKEVYYEMREEEIEISKTQENSVSVQIENVESTTLLQTAK
eukprot:NODE_105_length_19280_cov_0.929461.p5 type:complete len:342 gc:universal NODE_105_length_19280_cov_0.929461:16139-15114(-)